MELNDQLDPLVAYSTGKKKESKIIDSCWGH